MWSLELEGTVARRIAEKEMSILKSRSRSLNALVLS